MSIVRELAEGTIGDYIVIIFKICFASGIIGAIVFIVGACLIAGLR